MQNVDMKKYHEKIIARAIKDEKFHNELKKSPKTVIERELGITCPANLSIQVIDQPSNKWYIIVPQVANAASLTDAQLLNIAGGGVGPTGEVLCSAMTCK